MGHFKRSIGSTVAAQTDNRSQAFTRGPGVGHLAAWVFIFYFEAKHKRNEAPAQVWKLNRVSSVDLESPDMSVELGQGKKMSTALVRHHWTAGSADICCSLQFSVCFS